MLPSSHETTVATFSTRDKVEAETIESRVRLLSDYGLSIGPLRAMDSGEYQCVVNNRKRKSTKVKLMVQGENNEREIQFISENNV